MGDEPTSSDLIAAAVRDGTIDLGTGLLYRLYAQIFDPRLPDAYRGDASEDFGAAEAAERARPTLAADQQAALLPFLVRPTDPDSIFQQVATTASHGNRLVLATVDPRCGANGFHREDVPSIPLTIWGRCATDGLGNTTYTLEPQVNELKGFMIDLWPRMTGLMGTPIGDSFKNPAQRGPNEPEEAGDGRIDIYVVLSDRTPYLRNLTNTFTAVARGVSPIDHGTASGYIVYDPSKGATAAKRKADMAHEFFHVLQNRYNAGGTVGCPYPSLATNCPATDWDPHWFVEASATWAEHHFVPEARDPWVYGRYTGFLTSAVSMSDTSGTNAYRSFAWPYFMEQESGRGADVIADTWKALERRDGWTAVQQVVDHFMPFDAHFGDFAVRVWNEFLEPGNPIDPHFRADPIDPAFPLTMPNDESLAATPRFKDHVMLDPARNTLTFNEDLPDLWADYYDLDWTADTRQVTLVFSGLAPSASLGVDALVKVKDRGWQRRTLGAGTIQWCLDQADDAIEQAILVLSNHDLGPDKPVTGSWTAAASDRGCATATDTLVYTSLIENGTPGDFYYTSQQETMTVRVSLASAPGGNARYLPLENDSSTYSATYDAQAVLVLIDGSECISNTNGRESDAFPQLPDDSGVGINGSVYQEPDGSWTMSISASVNVHVTTIVSGGCADSGQSDQDLQLPDCVGTEIRDSDPVHTFDFHCDYAAPGYKWSVIGKVSVSTLPA